MVTTEFTSHELRFASSTSDSFEYLVGLYYADADTARTFSRGPVFGASFDATAGTESMAAFGQATVHLSETTRLNIGGRYNREEISVDFLNVLTTDRFVNSDSEGVFLGKVSLQHDLNDQVMVFASATKGYKGQAYDITSSFVQDRADNPVKSETSLALELGAKGTYFDGQLQLNAVAFHTGYDDYQAQNTTIDGGAITLKVNNVGSLKTYGLEVDGVALIGENASVNFSVAYIKATIDDWVDAGCFARQAVDISPTTGCRTVGGIEIQDLSGEDLNNSPDLKLTLGGQYDIGLDSLPFDGVVNVNYVWQDATHFALLNNPLTEQDAYGIMNLSVGLVEREDERYQLTAFVNNVFDKSYAVNIDDASGGLFRAPATTHILPRGAERYAGVRLRLNF